MADVAKRYSKRLEWATPTVVQQAHGNSTTTSVSAAWPAPTTAGNLLIAVACVRADAYGTPPFGAVPSTGSTAQGVITNPTPDYRVSVSVLANAASRSGTETWTGLTNGNLCSLYLLEIANTNVITDGAGASGSSVSGWSMSGLTVSGGSGSKGIEVIGLSAGWTTTPDALASGAWVELTNASGNGLQAWYRIFTATTSVETQPSGTFGFSTSYAGAGVIYSAIDTLDSNETVVPSVSASKKVILRDINIANKDVSTATVDVDIDGTPDSSLFSDLSVPVGQTIQWTGFVPLDAGETLTAQSNKAVDVTVGAVEVDA